MKYVILLGDGMADRPLAELGGKTPLEAARTPNMDRIAGTGLIGLVDTIPEGLVPGSDVANLSVLGYDPRSVYSGRGPLEAANMGVRLKPDDVAFRCNLVTLAGNDLDVMDSYSAGHIGTDEAASIITDLHRCLGSDEFQFHPGISYRHLLVWKGGKASLATTPPHDITGRKTASYLPKGEGEQAILRLMEDAAPLLSGHPINRQRIAAGKKPANGIWPWGQGLAPRLVPLTETYGILGGMISAVDLLNGMGVYAGLNVIRVEGATGFTDTNYIGKAQKAIESLGEMDFIFVHVEAPDEMGHAGDIEGKIRAIEDFDEKVVGTVLKGLETLKPYRIMVLSDHPTPIKLRTHSSEPSPFAVLSSEREENPGRGAVYSEAEGRRSGLLLSPGYLLMERFIRGRLHA
ncbi:MAG: cofactor-independent phosphoglycerate mutase [Syntrophaceae bacterium]|nr:cofactor-independent phosphoglycerate mutase [Syntrophaceae bacterium]